MFRVDGSRQAQGAGEGAARKLADEILALICLVLTLDADDILENLNVQILGLQSRYQSGNPFARL